MRVTVFRRLMSEEFGAIRATTLSTDHVFAGLNGRTIEQALTDGVDPKEIWRTVCETLEVPPERR